MTEVTILMPCLNEEETVVRCVRQARAWLHSRQIPGQVLVADNDSTDSSRAMARRAGADVIRVPERGYGNALRGGIREARGTYVIMGDCDGSYDFSDLDRMLEQLRQGAALVMGDRFAGGIRPGAMPFAHRYLGVPVLSFLGRLRFRTDVRDFHCGLRGFHRQSALDLDLRCGGMEFATEIIGRFAEAGLPIRQVPVALHPDGRSGRSHLRPIADGLRHLALLIFWKKRK